MKFKVTVEYEYEVSDDGIEEEYDATDPADMAEIDERNFKSDPSCLIADLADLPYSVKVVPA